MPLFNAGSGPDQNDNLYRSDQVISDHFTYLTRINGSINSIPKTSQWNHNFQVVELNHWAKIIDKKDNILDFCHKKLRTISSQSFRLFPQNHGQTNQLFYSSILHYQFSKMLNHKFISFRYTKINIRLKNLKMLDHAYNKTKISSHVLIPCLELQF